MRRSELKKLIDLDLFYKEVERISTECECTYLEAAQEYSRLNDIDDDLLAQIIKTSRGNFKAKLTEQCEELLLIKA